MNRPGLIIFSVLLSVALYYTSASSVYIDTKSSRYRGVRSKSGRTSIFYGIPYAEPPLGERRFRAPVSLSEDTESKQRVIDTRRPKEFCIQSAINPGKETGGAGSEDCLALNIYSPTQANGQTSLKLPVLVYIHGGSFLYGNPLSWSFEHWVEQFPDVVVVSIYYRLSIFGFLAVPNSGVGVDDDIGLDYNVGFLDQVEALKWIKQNIGSFGGDTESITINGQSAGGASVLLHLLAYNGQQTLFHQAIGQSIYRPALVRANETGDYFSYVVSLAGCENNVWSNKEKVGCLRAKDSGVLIRAAEAAQKHNSTWRYIPVVDGYIFKDTPTVLVNQGKFSHVPMLVGSTTDESAAGSANFDFDREMKGIWPALSQSDLTVIKEAYKSSDFKNEKERVVTAVGETMNRCPRELLAEAQTRAGHVVYAYRFDEPNPTENTTKVQHSAENWWMFQGTNIVNNGSYTLTPFTTKSQYDFAKELIAYWVSFVRSGNPNTYAVPGSPHWPIWEVGISSSQNKDSGSNAGKRTALRQGHTITNAQLHHQEQELYGYISGTMVEDEPTAEFERCRSINSMADRFHI